MGALSLLRPIHRARSASPAVTLEPGTATQQPKLTVDGTWSGLAEDASLTLVVDTFASADAPVAQTLLQQILAPDPTGKATIKTSIPYLTAPFGPWLKSGTMTNLDRDVGRISAM